MKILITGALGNVGSYVIDQLKPMGEKLIAGDIFIDKLNEKYSNETHIEPVYFDFTDQSTFDKALENVDRVFLMRPPHIGNPSDLLPFILALKKANIKLVVFLSLMGVEKNPIPPHHKIEKLIEKYNIPFTHIRPGFFMQNISGVHAYEIKTYNKIYIPAGKSKTSFIDAKDIGLAIATVLSAPEKHINTSYTITGPESLDYQNIANILSDVLEREITYAKPSFLKYRKFYIKERGLDKSYVNITMMLYFMTRMGTAKKVTQEFERLTGKKPRTFKTFAKENKKAWI
ncbi:MAG: NmrA family NAD(P)-binding protein [Candidatus Izemoplasmatales bacterium]